MPITVNSPYSGQPVKLRDQDIGRAVRDEENRVFYVLERNDGSGYYSAITRQGGLTDEQRYDEMAGKMQRSEHHVQEETAVHTQVAGRRKSSRGKLVILFLLIVVLALAYYFIVHLSGQWNKGPKAGTIELGQVPSVDFIHLELSGTRLS
jgi:hypothetical protein